MKCKFCCCTDDRPCAIPVVTNGADEVVVAFPPTIAIGVTVCCWLIPGVCSAPACVEKAYLEIRDYDLEIVA